MVLDDEIVAAAEFVGGDDFVGLFLLHFHHVVLKLLKGFVDGVGEVFNGFG